MIKLKMIERNTNYLTDLILLLIETNDKKIQVI